MKKRLFASSVLLFSIIFQFALTLNIHGQNSTSIQFDGNRYTIPVKKFILSNGLTLLVNEDHSVPIVSVNTWYHVGSRNEKRGKTGFAHLFEHFFFNGSENYRHGFREAMDDLGANNRNGTTNTDRTTFFQDVPVSALERTLYLEADRMGFLSGNISKEMLERERGVVQNEKREDENNPYGRVFSEIEGKIYPYSHPYSWSTIGSMEDLSAASLDDIKEWYATYYRPNNAVLSLAGDITPERALDLVTKYYGGIPSGPPLIRTEKWIPQFDHNLRDEMEDRVSQARIYRVYHAPAWKDDEAQFLSLFADVLAGSKSSKLERRLVYEKGLATSVSAELDDRELCGVFTIIVTVKPDVDPAEAEYELDSAINELLEKGPTDEELQRYQNRNLAAFLRGNETLLGRSGLLAESMMYGGAPDTYLNHLKVMATARPIDVKNAANKWLRANHYTMLVKPFPRFAAGKSDIDRSILPSLGEVPEVKFPQVQRAKLKNGLNVLLLERHTTPIVNLTLAVNAGFSSDSNDKAGVASLSVDLMDEGTKTRNNFQISDQLDSLGANLSTYSGLDMSYVRLQATTANLHPSLEIMSDVVLNPSFPSDLFAVQKQRRMAQIGQEKAGTSIASRILPSILYGANHIYGKPTSGLGYEKTVESITREDLILWHEQWFKPGNATLVVAGDTTMDKLLPILEESFSNWKAGTAPAKNLTIVPKTTGKKIYLIDKPDAPQSLIIAAHLTEPRGQKVEDLAIEPVMVAFGGLATSRLNRNLRLDKHWSYGTIGGIQSSRGQRIFIVNAPVQTDKTKESMIEVSKEINDIAENRPIKGEEFNSTMRSINSKLPARFETLGSLESAALTLINNGLPDDYWSRYIISIRGLNEAQLDAAAKKYVHPDEIIWMIVGDVKKIEKGIRELGYGEIIKLNVDGEVIN